MKFTSAEASVRTFSLNELKLGDCFLFDSRIGMLVSRNGHRFPIDLATGKEFPERPVKREWIPQDFPPTLPMTAQVVKLDTELIYKIIR